MTESEKQRRLREIGTPLINEWLAMADQLHSVALSTETQDANAIHRLQASRHEQIAEFRQVLFGPTKPSPEELLVTDKLQRFTRAQKRAVKVLPDIRNFIILVKTKATRLCSSEQCNQRLDSINALMEILLDDQAATTGVPESSKGRSDVL